MKNQENLNKKQRSTLRNKLIDWLVEDLINDGFEYYSLDNFTFRIHISDLAKVLKKHFRLKGIMKIIFSHSIEGKIFLRDNFLAYESGNGHIYLSF